MMAMTMIATPALTHMATSATASGGAPKLRHTSTAATHRRLNPTKKHMGSTKFLINITNHSPVSSLQRPYTVPASNNPQSQDQDSSTQVRSLSSSILYLF
ncbi:hypothetical protein Patl1_34559 [Pistacia atlantica]|uniref:Uncharacterized protein n=1 Tax=Pistacia atlantica TaxID=434234 RepID=A0ACC0ZR77_9ROSI|nr:hypothetical protein Patl1_34559 [Pistacia atlantica]